MHVQYMYDFILLPLAQYLPPALPDGIGLHKLISTNQSVWSNNDTLFTFNVTMEIIPASCDYMIPLISFFLGNSSSPGKPFCCTDVTYLIHVVK